LRLIPYRFFASAAFLVAATSHAQTGPIKIGDVNSYSALAAYTEPYRNGAILAAEETNAAGGVLGRRVEIVFRDDAFKPGDALRQAQELVSSEKVVALTGSFSSSVGLAMADFALQKKIPFVAGIAVTDALTWEKGNRYTFRTNISTYMHASVLAEEAAKLPAKRWATMAPNYEYGTAFVAVFKEQLSKRRPDVVWVAEQWPAFGKLDAGPLIDALNAAKPDAVFNAVFATDLIRFIREANTRGFFQNKHFFSGLTGQPEYRDPLGDGVPENWTVTGYPWEELDNPEHVRFKNAYIARFKDHPRWNSVVGYITYKAVINAIAKAKSTNPEDLVNALTGLSFEGPVGTVTYRTVDNQAAMPYFIGKLGKQNGKPALVQWRKLEADKLLPSPAETLKLRAKAQ
jgi:branched-chain amino acid transport system substrate-binding protein